jgi:hypothetical protein
MVINLRNLLLEGVARIGMKVPVALGAHLSTYSGVHDGVLIILIITESFNVAWLVQWGRQYRHYRGDALVFLPGRGRRGGQLV